VEQQPFAGVKKQKKYPQPRRMGIFKQKLTSLYIWLKDKDSNVIDWDLSIKQFLI